MVNRIDHEFNFPAPCQAPFAGQAKLQAGARQTRFQVHRARSDPFVAPRSWNPWFRDGSSRVLKCGIESRAVTERREGGMDGSDKRRGADLSLRNLRGWRVMMTKWIWYHSMTAQCKSVTRDDIAEAPALLAPRSPFLLSGKNPVTV